MMPIRILQLSLAVFASILLLDFFQLQHTEIPRLHSESRSVMLKYFDALVHVGKRIQGQGLDFMVRGVLFNLIFIRVTFANAHKLFNFLGMHPNLLI